MLPFSRDQFFDVFARYNEAVWPTQLALTGAGVACAVAALLGRGGDRAISYVLAGLWAWMAVAYHFAFFASINPAAWLFGCLFLVATALFAAYGTKSTLRFGGARGIRGVAGVGLVAYALILYPVIGSVVGHAYPRTPTFGLPCPTTIFTLGMLLLARRPVPGALFIVPMLWSAVGTFAAIELGVTQDYGLPLAALVTAVLMIRRPIQARLSH